MNKALIFLIFLLLFININTLSFAGFIRKISNGVCPVYLVFAFKKLEMLSNFDCGAS